MMNPLQNHHFILSTVANDTRQKITQFFQDELEKKMTPRVSIEAQQLKCMHKDLELKRKCSKKDEKNEKERLSEAKKCGAPQKQLLKKGESFLSSMDHQNRIK